MQKILVISDNARKQLKKLPPNIQKKAKKQFIFLISNYKHPSLQTSKMYGDVYEGRIDIHYRFSFTVKGGEIWILVVGMHDVGLGKK